jgi:hypothetical protein
MRVQGITHEPRSEAHGAYPQLENLALNRISRPSMKAFSAVTLCSGDASATWPSGRTRQAASCCIPPLLRSRQRSAREGQPPHSAIASSGLIVPYTCTLAAVTRDSYGGHASRSSQQPSSVSPTIHSEARTLSREQRPPAARNQFGFCTAGVWAPPRGANSVSSTRARVTAVTCEVFKQFAINR